ncbi:MAG: efflux RND transporter periplasmic adaptor subunit [Chlamydiales bacterium]|nr:efflux RND transporter periplasmic adaptor subunit [Chlamydiales bacterium]
MLLGRLLLFCAAVMSFSSLDAESFRVVLEPRHRTALSAEIISTVTTIPKRMGEMFKKNEVLMTLDDQVYKSNHDKMIAVLERAKAELSAQKRLYADKAASLLELREAEAKLAAARADLTQATKELKACTLMAPYDGEVQDVHVQEYERVEPGKPLMDILDAQILVAKLLVPSRVGLSIKVGQKLKISIPEVQGTYTAVVTHVAPGIDPSSSLIKIDSEINNKDRSLRSGMIGALEITSEEASP